MSSHQDDLSYVVFGNSISLTFGPPNGKANRFLVWGDFPQGQVSGYEQPIHPTHNNNASISLTGGFTRSITPTRVKDFQSYIYVCIILNRRINLKMLTCRKLDEGLVDPFLHVCSVVTSQASTLMYMGGLHKSHFPIRTCECNHTKPNNKII